MSVPILTFFNNKGGVGKTTLVYHLAWTFSELGHRVVAVDLDPQANLTSLFLPEETLEKLWDSPDEPQAGTTVDQCIRPFLDHEKMLPPVPLPISDTLHLVPGDLGLAEFEDLLSREWPYALDPVSQKPALRILTAFWQIAQQAAAKHAASLVLVDVGPNLGAINRSALLASNHIVFPLAADLFSLQGLKNLGPTLNRWRTDWKMRCESWANPSFALPIGDMRPMGYIIQQYAERLSRPTKSYGRWAARIPDLFRKAVLGSEPQPSPLTPDTDPWCLARHKHYRSLIPMGQEARKPIFHLTSADGAIGNHAAAVNDARREFRELALKILQRIENAQPPPAAPIA